MRAVESDSVKSARKAKDKLYKACEERQKLVSELCIGRNKTECAWHAQFAQRFQTLSCLPYAFCFVPAYAQFAQTFQTLSYLLCAFYLALSSAQFAQRFQTLSCLGRNKTECGWQA